MSTRSFWCGMSGLILALLAVASGLMETRAAVLDDSFGAATMIFGVTNVVGSSTNATAQPGEPPHCGEPARHSVWARWTATATGTHVVSTTNSSFDTVLAVYLGTTLGNLKPVTTNDDFDFRTLTSLVFFRAYAGETFHFAIDGIAGARGAVSLKVDLAGPRMQEWTTTDVHGREMASSTYLNKVLLVDFWETTCGACVAELPQLVQLHNTLAPRGFTILGLGADLDWSLVQEFVYAHDEIPYPMGMSSPGPVAALLGGPVGMPTKYLVDLERKIVARYEGGHDPPEATYDYYAWQASLLLRPSSRPRLLVRQQVGSMTFSWVPGDLPLRLESASQPGFTGWTAAGGLVQTNNGQLEVTLPVETDGRFFRLALP